jgi:NAD(P)-dependent dehydrogenase (short-subunit alcohol dehydrogenase family)
MKSNPFSLAGKRALVVGADSGIGLACARAIADAGAKLAIAGLNAAAGKTLAEEIAKDSGSEVAYFAVDVRDEAAVAAMVDKAVGWLGGLEIAMNNAGIPGPAGRVQDMDAADFDNLFAINVRGAWLGMKYEIPHLLAGGSGSIINLASTAAITGLPYVASYAATKHAVAGLTKSVALELAASKIRVNAIAPGPVETGLLHAMRDDRKKKIPEAPSAKVPMDRVAAPEEMAGAVVWLASDASSFVTGAIISIDGGVVAA